ncbi:MAG: YiiG family protein [Rhodanobacter sp.]|nr:YiiG family protein [Rhodanobacter sp.]
MIAAVLVALTLSACSQKEQAPAPSAPAAAPPAAPAPSAVASTSATPAAAPAAPAPNAAASTSATSAAAPAAPAPNTEASASATPAAAPATPAPNAAASASATPAPAQSDQADEISPQAKLNLYIECYNKASGSFRRSLNRYQSWVKDMKVGPTGNERIVYGLYPVNGAQSCKKAIAAANAAAPKMPALEQVANAYAASLEPLQATINDAYTYYDRENYKDDGFAKGKTLHQALAEQANAFTTANRQFSDALEDANDAMQQEHLQRMEKQSGRNLAYYHLSTMIQAKGLMRVLEQDNVDIEKTGAKIDAFEKTVDEMAKASGNKPTMWDAYAHNVEEFRKTAKALFRRLRDKTPYSTGERSLLGTSGGWMVEGSPDKLINAYNTMVETSNNLN